MKLTRWPTLYFIFRIYPELKTSEDEHSAAGIESGRQKTRAKETATPVTSSPRRYQEQWGRWIHYGDWD